MKTNVKILLTIMLVSIVVSATLVYSSLSFTTYLESGSMANPCSYVVFKDGATYYLKDGLTGHIVISGTNVTTVVQYALDTLFADDTGGIIFFAHETYYFSAPLSIISSGITLLGDSREKTIFVSTIAFDEFIQVGSASYRIVGTNIRQIRFQGEAEVQHAIRIYAGEHTTISRCYFERFLNYSIYSVPMNSVGGDTAFIFLTECTTYNCSGFFFADNGTTYAHTDIYLYKNQLKCISGGITDTQVYIEDSAKIYIENLFSGGDNVTVVALVGVDQWLKHATIKDVKAEFGANNGTLVYVWEKGNVMIRDVSISNLYIATGSTVGTLIELRADYSNFYCTNIYDLSAAEIPDTNTNGIIIGSGVLCTRIEIGKFNYYNKNVTSIITDNGSYTVINGLGHESVGAGNPPTENYWAIGDIIENSDDGTLWLKRTETNVTRIDG